MQMQVCGYEITCGRYFLSYSGINLCFLQQRNYHDGASVA